MYKPLPCYTCNPQCIVVITLITVIAYHSSTILFAILRSYAPALRALKTLCNICNNTDEILINSYTLYICYMFTKVFTICISESVHFCTMKCVLFYTPLGSLYFQALRDIKNGNFLYHHQCLYSCTLQDTTFKKNSGNFLYHRSVLYL
jgi:hypothetical protein